MYFTLLIGILQRLVVRWQLFPLSQGVSIYSKHNHSYGDRYQFLTFSSSLTNLAVHFENSICDSTTTAHCKCFLHKKLVLFFRFQRCPAKGSSQLHFVWSSTDTRKKSLHFLQQFANVCGYHRLCALIIRPSGRSWAWLRCCPLVPLMLRLMFKWRMKSLSEGSRLETKLYPSVKDWFNFHQRWFHCACLIRSGQSSEFPLCKLILHPAALQWYCSSEICHTSDLCVENSSITVQL